MWDRIVKLVSAETVADSGAKIIDLDVSEPITTLTTILQLTNGGAKAPNLPPARIVSNIEIFDGGNTYQKLNGQETIGTYWLDTGIYPYRWLCEIELNPQIDAMPICFGRWVGDTEYAFDARRFVNPQLKVEWSKDALHGTGTLQLTVLAHVMDGVPVPNKALFWKIIESFTSVASGDKVVYLPCDYPYQKFGLRVWESLMNPQVNINNVKLACDVDRLVIFDMSHTLLQREIENLWGKFIYSKFDKVDDADTREHWGGAKAQIDLRWCQETVGGAVHSGNTWLTYNAKTNAGASASGQGAEVTVQGFMPESITCWPFGDMWDPGSWFDPTPYQTIRATVTQGNAGAACDVMLRQPRPFPK